MRSLRFSENLGEIVTENIARGRIRPEFQKGGKPFTHSRSRANVGDIVGETLSLLASAWPFPTGDAHPHPLRASTRHEAVARYGRYLACENDHLKVITGKSGVQGARGGCRRDLGKRRAVLA